MKTAIFAVVVFAVVIGGSSWAGKLPLVLPVAFLVASFIAFGAYAIDKSAARNGRRRISERTLHLLSLVGGWPGALIAQQAFRHKTQKVTFRIAFWATVLINCTVVIWF